MRGRLATLLLGLILQGAVGPRVLERPEPEYPPLARAARVESSVRLTATVKADGTLENLTVVNGHPLLNEAAIQAVQKWKFSTSPFGGVVNLDVSFTLPRVITGSINGQVVDADGHPMAGVRVVARKLSYTGGRRTFSPSLTGAGRTNAEGVYTVSVSEAGDYYIVANYEVPPDAPFGIADRVAPQTYFPGTPDAFAAVPVSVKLEAITIADIRVPSMDTVRITGRVQIPPLSETPAKTVDIRLFRIGDSRFADEPVALQTPRLDGKSEIPFDFRGVRPGQYRLVANLGTGPPNWDYNGRMEIDVRDRSIETLSLLLRRNIEFIGRVIADGPPIRLEGITLGIVARDGAAGGFLPVTADGTVRLYNLPEGIYSPQFRGLPGNSYVSDIRVGGLSLYEEGLIPITDRPPENLTFLLKANGGFVAGVVQTSLGGKVGGAQVFLVPEAPRRRNSLLYRLTKSDDAGGFRFAGIPPGDYKVFAFEIPPPSGAMESGEFIALYEQRGVRVVVREGTDMPGVIVQQIAKP